MSVLVQVIFAIFFGLISTLPLGPSGLSIVSTFVTNGTKKGLISLSALALVEIIYLTIALSLRARGILSLSNNIEVIFSLIFGLFLIAFGSITFKQSKKKESNVPKKFKSIFVISLMNPSLIISYLGLIILMDKSTGSTTNGAIVLALSFTLLSTSWLTLFVLGKFAQIKQTFINNNMHTIKSIIGPIFVFVGLSTLVSTF